jgi:hypothetical protein
VRHSKHWGGTEKTARAGRELASSSGTPPISVRSRVKRKVLSLFFFSCLAVIAAADSRHPSHATAQTELAASGGVALTASPRMERTIQSSQLTSSKPLTSIKLAVFCTAVPTSRQLIHLARAFSAIFALHTKMKLLSVALVRGTTVFFARDTLPSNAIRVFGLRLRP